MKHINYILVFVLFLTSCASRKNLSRDIVYDENAEKYQQALQRSKDAFFASDSADIIYNNLGWAERLLNETEFDTDEFLAASVVVEHKQLGSALVEAKMQGVDAIYSCSNQRIVAHSNEKDDYVVDTIEYTEQYADYMRKAQFACLCIMKEKKKYIVNATIRIPKSMENAEKPAK